MAFIPQDSAPSSLAFEDEFSTTIFWWFSSNHLATGVPAHASYSCTQVIQAPSSTVSRSLATLALHR